MHCSPQEGPREEILSDLLLGLVLDQADTERLRGMLSAFLHRCRNLLSGMKMSLYLVRREAPGPLPCRMAEVEETYRSIECLFDRLQAIYRPVTLTPIRARLGSLVADREEGWRESFRAAGASLEISPPREDRRGDFDPSYLELGLDAFVAWRASSIAAGQTASLSWRTEGSEFEVSWGESPDSAAVRHAEAGQGPPRSGLRATISSLGLPLLARMITAHRGILEWEGTPLFQVRFRWPMTLSEPAECAGR
jgi:hypothetical protein